MVLVDSGVWIDYFNGVATKETDLLHRLLGREPVAVGDLVLAEVLGLRDDRDYRTARTLLGSLVMFDLLGARRAIKVAENYRPAAQGGGLRSRHFTGPAR